MPCKKNTSIKFSSRPSPPYPAGQCPIGSKKRGNSGDMYSVKSNVNGVKRWVKVANKPRKTVNDTGKIRRKSSCDGSSVTFMPHFTMPWGKFMFYDEKTKDFRSPSRWGTDLLHGKSAALLVKHGWKVWVVKSVPKVYRQE